jgi:hypothetical protein
MNISASDLLAIRDANDLRTAANLAWHAANNAGEGYDPEGEDLGDLVLAATSDDQVSIYRDGDDVILVGDASGAWAVRVTR